LGKNLANRITRKKQWRLGLCPRPSVAVLGEGEGMKGRGYRERECEEREVTGGQGEAR